MIYGLPASLTPVQTLRGVRHAPPYVIGQGRWIGVGAITISQDPVEVRDRFSAHGVFDAKCPSIGYYADHRGVYCALLPLKSGMLEVRSGHARIINKGQDRKPTLDEVMRAQNIVERFERIEYSVQAQIAYSTGQNIEGKEVPKENEVMINVTEAIAAFLKTIDKDPIAA